MKTMTVKNIELVKIMTNIKYIVYDMNFEHTFTKSMKNSTSKLDDRKSKGDNTIN